MHLNLQINQSKRRQQSGVTLLELMVAISVLTFIILGLYSMFDRTQKVFLESLKEVDMQESGRAFMSIMTRDLEQMEASKLPNRVDFFVSTQSVNGFYQSSLVGGTGYTNVVQDFFFLTKTSSWNGVGYLIGQLSTNANDGLLYTNFGVGGLYRVSTNVNDYTLKSLDVLGLYISNKLSSQLVTEGVMHLELRTYDKFGNYLNPYTNNFTNGLLPAYVELEVGVLEPKMLAQVRSISDLNVQRNLLQETTNHPSAVHIYRSPRIPVRSAN